MKKTFAKAAVSVAIVTALVGGTSTAANAVTAGGGSWEYGVSTGMNWSSYHHGSFYHRATALNTGGGFKRAYAEAGYWARASITAVNSGNQAAWYHDSGNRNI